MDTLTRRAWLGLTHLCVALALCLFLAAGTLRYWQAWLFLAVFFGASAAITVYLQRYDRALLQRRMKAGPRAERRRGQQVAQLVASLAFLAIFVAAGFEHRLRGAARPAWLAGVGDLAVLLGFGIVFLVFRENSYTSASIETATGQQVIATGPYAVVRHPMYAGALLMLLGTPAALASLWAYAAVGLIAAAIVWRLRDEEALLLRELAGYDRYRAQVRYRLVPFLW